MPDSIANSDKEARIVLAKPSKLTLQDRLSRPLTATQDGVKRALIMRGMTEEDSDLVVRFVDSKRLEGDFIRSKSSEGFSKNISWYRLKLDEINQKWLSVPAETEQLIAHHSDTSPSVVRPKNVKLPTWYETQRAVPNCLLRCALFSVSEKKAGNSIFIKNQQIASSSDIVIKYTGGQLSLNDLRLYMTLLHVVREQDLGKTCSITGYELLKRMGQVDSGPNYNSLHDSICLLTSTLIQIEHKGKRVYGRQLIASFDLDTARKSKEYKIQFHPELLDLFRLDGKDTFTLLDWDVYQDLDGYLTRWLYCYYSTHAKPHPILVETLQNWCGSKMNRQDFSKRVRRSLSNIKKLLNAKCKTFEFSVEKGKVTVYK